MTLYHSSKGCFGSGYWSFYGTRPGRGFVSFFFHPVGAAFPPCRGFVSFFLPFLLSGLTSPLLPPSYRASSESPPGSQIWDSNRSPFGFVLTNPALFDAPPFLQRDALVLVTGLFMYPAGALFLFFHPVGAAFPPCRGFVSFFLPFSLAVLPPPFYHPAIGLHRSPPPEVRYGIRTGPLSGLC